jgi:hypothetical protein
VELVVAHRLGAAWFVVSWGEDEMKRDNKDWRAARQRGEYCGSAWLDTDRTSVKYRHWFKFLGYATTNQIVDVLIEVKHPSLLKACEDFYEVYRRSDEELKAFRDRMLEVVKAQTPAR